jgi:hypothetical protein
MGEKLTALGALSRAARSKARGEQDFRARDDIIASGVMSPHA